MTLEPALIRSVLEAGLRAPSAENKHFLRFELGDKSFRLIATDPSSAALPHRRWLASMSHGAVAENMVLRASALGLGLEVRWVEPQPASGVVAEFHWGGTAPVDALASFIDQRHTNRRFFNRAPLAAPVLTRLTEAASGAPGAHMVWLTDAPRTAALRAIRIAETERFLRPRLHGEMFETIRFDGGWRGEADEGLPLPALEVELPARAMFSAIRHWRVMRAMTLIGAHHALGLRTGYLPAALAPHVGVIVSDQARPGIPADAAAGRALQRVWLAAAGAGVAFQPFASPTALARQRPGRDGWVSEGAHTRLGLLLNEVASGVRGAPQMFFRVGMANAPSGVTGRPAVERFIG